MFTSAKASKKRKTKAGISNETIFRLQFSLPKLRRIDSNKAAVARKNADCAKMSVEIAVPLFYFSHPRGVQKKTERTVPVATTREGGGHLTWLHLRAAPSLPVSFPFPALLPKRTAPPAFYFPFSPLEERERSIRRPGGLAGRSEKVGSSGGPAAMPRLSGPTFIGAAFRDLLAARISSRSRRCLLIKP